MTTQNDPLKEGLAELERRETELKAKTEELAKANQDTEEAKAKLSGLTQELTRVQADLAKAREERRTKDSTFEEKFRNEQLEKAKNMFFEKFKYEPDKQGALLDAFKRLDSGSVDAENIYRDLVRSHLYLNPDKYVELESQVEGWKKAADEFNANSSSSAFNASHEAPPASSIELTKEDLMAAQWAGIPIEKYKELKAKGRV